MNSTALAVIQKHEANKDLVFVRPEDLQTQRMFVPEVTVLHATPDDFHDVSGKKQPKSYFVDRVGEAAGVTFIAENCGSRKDSEDVYVGFAQGKRRLPDGTWRSSQVQEYEFDVSVRSEEDFLKDKKNQYNSEIAKKKHTLEYKKFARQRACTGARLRVIRELVGIPIGFEPGQIQKAIVVSRISLNTDEMFSDPNMRQAAVQHAVGAQQALFGPGQGNTERDVTAEPPALPEAEQPPEQEETIPFADDIPWNEKPEDITRRGLQHYLDNNDQVYSLPAEAIELIRNVLAVENVTLEALQDCEKRIKEYIARKEQGNEKYAAHMMKMREEGRVIA